MLMQSLEAQARPAPAAGPRPSVLLHAIVAVIVMLALAVPLLIVATTPRVLIQKRPPVVLSKRVVPKAELPPVEPVQLQAVTADDARSINASIPFSTLPNPAARAFRIFGAEASQARAVDCLAAAVYYEAGDDAVGQRAVAQVIINRARHPAFPKTICGVVFQGSERSTGCQFTFTCDGAMLRYGPGAAAWQRARDVARAALNGSVYKPVGHATHYHTDWVVPYWSASLEKISEVHTHLFFRWAGWWGTPPAFTRGYAGAEPNVPQMARLSAAHEGPSDALLPPNLQGEGRIVDPATIPDSAVPRAMGAAGADADSFLVTLDRTMNPDAFAALAIKTCGERPYCKFMAWTDAKKTPGSLPLNAAQVSSMSFSYLRDQSQGFAKALWNCAQFKRPSPVQCMRVQTSVSVSLPTPTLVAPAAAPPVLTGVRRKGDSLTLPKPTVNLTMPAPKATPNPADAPSASETR